jgi:hypothetical protein
MKTQRPPSLRHLVPSLMLILVLAGAAGAQKVPATAREAATSPQFAPRLAHRSTGHRAPPPARGSSCSRLPQSYGSPKKLLQDPVIYDNGPYNGTTDAWTINFGFATSDSFTCGGEFGCAVEDFHMVTWNIPGFVTTGVEIQLGSTSFGRDYDDLSVAPSGSTDLGSNQFGYELWRYDFTFPVSSVPTGTSWVTLSNATDSGGNPVYWDENSGPSTAYENSVGSIPSETLTVTGNGGSSGCMPEQDGNFKVIHDFSGQDGSNPVGLTIDKAGNLYGPTYTFLGGTVFKMLKAGSAWVLNTLYTFAGQGPGPEELIIGRNGILYGAAYGGIQNCPYYQYCGLIFSLRPEPTACLTGSCSCRRTYFIVLPDPPTHGRAKVWFSTRWEICMASRTPVALSNKAPSLNCAPSPPEVGSRPSSTTSQEVATADPPLAFSSAMTAICMAWQVPAAPTVAAWSFSSLRREIAGPRPLSMTCQAQPTAPTLTPCFRTAPAISSANTSSGPNSRGEEGKVLESFSC